MGYSFYEIYTTSQRAFKGMGFPFGADEDAAYIIAWLELNNFKGVNILKKIIGQTTAYVSNVLITNEFRGLGYSKFLMYTCEGMARSWGYGSIFLHVDASVTSGKAAQGLYLGLGYQPVTSEVGQKNINDKWTFMTGPNMMNRGVYMVEGVPLLYLKKDLE